MKYLLLISALLFTSCKISRKVTHTDTHTISSVKDSVHTAVDRSVQVTQFDDTLTNSSFAPATDSGEVVESESKGIKVAVKITPRKNKEGQITGSDVHLIAIAKPVSKVEELTKTQAGEVHQQQVRQDVKEKVKEKKKTGLSVSWWIWILAIAGIVIAVFRLRKYLKFFI